jgi:hypothetical protein
MGYADGEPRSVTALGRSSRTMVELHVTATSVYG